jgi:hypothetical protein
MGLLNNVFGMFSFLKVSSSGDCLFQAFVENFDVPGYVLTADDLRRMCVYGLVEFAPYMFEDASVHILGTYDGEDGTDGPFSYLEYCQHILSPGHWGDELCIKVLAQLFGLTITVANFVSNPNGGPTLLCYHHKEPLSDTQIVLLFNGSNHYSATGMLKKML